MRQRKPITILMADDDADDRQLTQAAFEEARVGNLTRFVEDGEELLDYLRGEGRYSEPGSAPRPDLILLDLNMPKMDGRQALAEIKKDPELRRIPVVVLTISDSEEDIYRTYDLGVAGYIAKPVTFEGLVEVVRATGIYWIEIVTTPDGDI